MLDKTIPRIGRIPNIITINARRINNVNKIGHPKIKKAIISDGFFAESRSYGTPFQPPKQAKVESTTK
jgi:hypothetical protein